MSNGLLDDPVEYRPRHRRVAIAAPAVLRQRRRIEHFVGQLQTQIPAIGDIDLDLANQLTFRADAAQVTDEQRLEHHHGIKRWTAVVRAVEILDQFVDKGKINRRVNATKKVILSRKRLEA